MYSLLASLTKWADLHPQQACIVEAETHDSITYADYLVAVAAMRRFLGTTPRCIVLQLPGGILNAVLWMSALTGGHTLVPVSPTASTTEKKRVQQFYHPTIWFAEDATDLQYSDSADKVTLLSQQQGEAIIQQGVSTADLPLASLQGSVCLMTSGTTGDPKSVMLTEPQVAWTAAHVCSSHQLSTLDRGLTMLPFSHVNAPVVSLFASIMAGSTVVIAQRFSRRHFWSWVHDYQVSWISAVPTILAMLLETEKPAFLPGPLRFVRTASAPLPVAVLQAFESRFGIPVIETYGLSEAASQVAANPVPPGLHKPGSVGLPVGVSLRICRPRDAEEQELAAVPVGEIGEICVYGPAIIQSYQGDTGNSAFQRGWFRTGDLGWRDEDGYIFITGRLRDVIIRGGENIAPREVEEVLLRHPGVSDAAVIGRPDTMYGEVVVAYIVSRDQQQTDFVADLKAFATQHLSRPKVPVDFILIDSLPRNASGKLARQVLHEREAMVHA